MMKYRALFGRYLPGLIVAAALAGCSEMRTDDSTAQARRSEVLKGAFGTYDAEPRLPNGRVDTDRLVRELVTIHANSYNFLVWRAKNDWDDLKLFLPKAAAHHLRVWVTICPPSESPPHTHNYSEPFRMDYPRWAAEIARLSRRQPALVAWSLDDFSYGSKEFAPDYVRQMIGAAREINPRLAFIPCVYYMHVTPQFGEQYRGLLDGVLFPYRHEAGKRNLSEWDTLETELAKFHQCFGRSVPVIVDVYATRLARVPDSSPEYVRQVMQLSRQKADGLMIYCHQYEATSPEKYRVIKDLFTEWSAEAPVTNSATAASKLAVP